MSATGAHREAAPSAVRRPSPSDAPGATPSGAGGPAHTRATTYAEIKEAPISIDSIVERVGAPQVGGIGVFIGVIRDRDDGSDVRSLDYSRHPTATDVLRQCAERVAATHDVLAVAVEHRVGHLEVGDLAVVVAVSAVHRGPALEACRQLIDRLKVEVPIWKEQHFADGTTGWVGLG